MFEPKNIGTVVEDLITIKGRYDLSRSETESVNDACNILYKGFDPMKTKYDVIDDLAASVSFYREDVREMLKWHGGEASDEQVDKVLAKFQEKENKKRIQEAMKQACRAAILLETGLAAGLEMK